MKFSDWNTVVNLKGEIAKLVINDNDVFHFSIGKENAQVLSTILELRHFDAVFLCQSVLKEGLSAFDGIDHSIGIV